MSRTDSNAVRKNSPHPYNTLIFFSLFVFLNDMANQEFHLLQGSRQARVSVGGPEGPIALGCPQRKAGQCFLRPRSPRDSEAFLGDVLIFSQNNQYFIRETEMGHSGPKRESETTGRVKTRLNKHLRACDRGSRS